MIIEIGKFNKLKVIKNTEEDVYLDAGNYGELLLSKKDISIDYQIKETIEVFLYCDAEGEIIPTTKKPYVIVGKFACLKVISVLPIGAFLDWGLPKDLFVPRGEQKEDMIEKESYVVYLYKENGRNRIAASSKLDAFLDKEPISFKENDQIDLLICDQTELGYKAIINDSYWGLLYKDEIFQRLEYGQRVKGFIKKVREKGKIDLNLERQGYHKMDTLEKRIISEINKEGGVLMVTDKSSPEIIRKLFGVSKKKYKIALGSLYKAKSIIIEDTVIKLK